MADCSPVNAACSGGAVKQPVWVRRRGYAAVQSNQRLGR